MKGKNRQNFNCIRAIILSLLPVDKTWIEFRIGICVCANYSTESSALYCLLFNPDTTPTAYVVQNGQYSYVCVINQHTPPGARDSLTYDETYFVHNLTTFPTSETIHIQQDKIELFERHRPDESSELLQK